MISPRLDVDYDLAITESSKSVLLEVMTILGEYRECLVLIGGWGPYFFLSKNPTAPPAAGFGAQSAPFRHIGSIDIDIAVNPEKITGEEYKTIVRLLEERDGSSRWMFDLTTYVPPTLPWLNINPATAPSNALDAVGAGQAREP